MKNLGKKEVDMYPTMESSEDKKKIHYPSMSLPINMLPEDAELGTEVSVKLKGKITRIEKSEYNSDFQFDAIEGEVG